jgi:linoleoyl-CoA desaturase
MPKVIFNNSNRSFFQSVKISVDAYFSSRQLKRTGNWKLYAKALILIPFAIAIYVFLLFGNYIGIMGMLLSVYLD